MKRPCFDFSGATVSPALAALVARPVKGHGVIQQGLGEAIGGLGREAGRVGLGVTQFEARLPVGVNVELGEFTYGPIGQAEGDLCHAGLAGSRLGADCPEVMRVCGFNALHDAVLSFDLTSDPESLDRETTGALRGAAQ